MNDGFERVTRARLQAVSVVEVAARREGGVGTCGRSVDGVSPTILFTLQRLLS